MRLDKFLCDMNYGTRKEVKELISNQKVSINGQINVSVKTQVNEHTDEICVNDEKVIYEQYVYYMLNKPSGYVTATKDRSEKTVMELLPAECQNLFPVGRLDKDTEGLLLLTNNGELAHRMLSPKKHVDKVYYAEVTGELTNHTITQFEQGIDIKEERLTLPAKLSIISATPEQSSAKVTIHEGKFHQVKRMFSACGHTVTYLKRLQMGDLILDEHLEVGQYKKIGETEWLKNIMP